MPATSDSAPLSTDEFRELAALLARSAETQLDQWAAWQLATSYGPVFIDVSRRLPDGHHGATYASIWPLPSQGPTSR